MNLFVDALPSSLCMGPYSGLARERARSESLDNSMLTIPMQAVHNIVAYPAGILP